MQCMSPTERAGEAADKLQRLSHATWRLNCFVYTRSMLTRGWQATAAAAALRLGRLAGPATY